MVIRIVEPVGQAGVAGHTTEGQPVFVPDPAQFVEIFVTTPNLESVVADRFDRSEKRIEIRAGF